MLYLAHFREWPGSTVLLSMLFVVAFVTMKIKLFGCCWFGYCREDRIVSGVLLAF